ncbi:hypothetical protein VKT23_000570 [Stygiomarasmius scandens]|uniref:Nitroreductase domain-containing protein n=1 Tax=Marasmiellus scandens TaxID=2682957 RepID=A0ABR1K4G7_9AGAR
MSVFEDIYVELRSDNRTPSPSQLEKNHKCAAADRHSEAADIVDSLMKNRFSCRYYLPKPVPKDLIEEIIDAARYAPSGNNMQPWEKVYCISGDILKAISAEMVEAHKEHPEAYSAQYHYYPPGPIPEAYALRRQDFGKRFYSAIHIDRTDLKARAAASTRNYEFFGAPVAFVFTINQALTQGSWMDVGYFLQSMIIAARARGLETISQVSTAKFSGSICRSAITRW